MEDRILFSFEDSNPYDLLAQLINQLRGIDKKAYLDSSYRDSISRPPSLEVIISSFLEEHPVFEDGMRMIAYGVPETDAEALLSQSGDFLTQLELLLQVERQLRWEEVLDSVYLKSLGQRGFFSLNGNTEETGIAILPKVRTINDDLDSEKRKKKYADQGDNGLNCEFANIYYIELEQLRYNGEPCGMRHYFPRIARSKWERTKNLRIALAPLAHGEFLKTREFQRTDKHGTELNLFSIDGIQDEERLRRIIKADYITACRKHADIIMFPEALGSKQIVSDEFRSELRQAAKYAVPDSSQPTLVLMPTWWHDQRNELYVSTSGRNICIQEKCAPFSYQSEKDKRIYREDLRSEAKEICVVHIPELGRLTFPICRDFLTNEYLKLMVVQARSTFLLCPAYSFGKTRFDLNATFPISYGCYTAMINSCGTHSEPADYLGLIAGPKPGDMSTVYLTPTCTQACPAGEEACIFLVEINVGDRTTITYEHFCTAS